MSSYRLPNGVLVLFLYEDSLNQGHSGNRSEGTADHLRVLYGFSKAWNANERDTNFKKPAFAAALAYPTTVLVVSAAHHKSNHSGREAKHITVYICGEAGWEANPPRSNACIHVYSRYNQVWNGFQSYWIKNSNANSFKSELIKEKLQRAKENLMELPPGVAHIDRIVV